MTTAEMVERANTFGRRFQWGTLTRRTLRSWQELQLLPKPDRAGLGYKRGRSPGYWSATNYRDVLRLCRMRHAKLSDEQKCIALWLLGTDIPFERVKDAAISQQTRLHKPVNRLPITWDPRQTKELQPRSKRALDKAIGLNEPALVKYPRDNLLKLIEVFVFEASNRSAIEEALNQIFTQLQLGEFVADIMKQVCNGGFKLSRR